MKDFCLKHKRLLIDIAVLVGVFLFVNIAFYVFKPLYFVRDTGMGTVDGIIPKIFVYTCILAVVVTGIVLKLKGKLTFEKVLFFIFLIGVLLQLLYMLMTPYDPVSNGIYRQHDVNTNFNDGHDAYAWSLFSTGQLPSKVDGDGHLAYQFYHPPLNAFVQSIYMHFGEGMMKLINAIAGKEVYDLTNHSQGLIFQTTEVLSTFYMNIAIYFGIKIAYNLKVDKKFKVFGAMFIALFPALIIQAGQVNNDPLCVMNCFIVIYYTIRWWENHSYYNAIMIGLFTGLAMMAKLSGALIILPAIVAFAVVFIQAIVKKETFKHYIFQGVIIAVIAAPLGLWFHLYAKVRFDQPFGFVFSNLTELLYVGDKNAFERFINIFDFGDLTYQLFGHTYENYNLPNFLIKSAIFGEYSFMGADAFGVFALATHYLFTYLSLALMVIYFIYSGKEHLEVKIIAGTLIITQLVAQLYFNIKMPYGCTMDFRYIVPIIIGFMILDVLAADKFTKENDWKKSLSIVTLAIGTLFIVSSSAFYLTMY